MFYVASYGFLCWCAIMKLLITVKHFIFKLKTHASDVSAVVVVITESLLHNTDENKTENSFVDCHHNYGLCYCED